MALLLLYDNKRRIDEVEFGTMERRVQIVLGIVAGLMGVLLLFVASAAPASMVAAAGVRIMFLAGALLTLAAVVLIFPYGRPYTSRFASGLATVGIGILIWNIVQDDAVKSNIKTIGLGACLGAVTGWYGVTGKLLIPLERFAIANSRNDKG